MRTSRHFQSLLPVLTVFVAPLAGCIENAPLPEDREDIAEALDEVSTTTSHFAPTYSVSACTKPTGTNIVVNTTADELNNDGDCSLREAIRAANTDLPIDACPAGKGRDLITIPAGNYGITIPGIENESLTGDYDLKAGAVIQGASATTSIISGIAGDFVFSVRTTEPVCFDSLTVRAGMVGIYNPAGLVTVRKSIIRDHSGSGWGGGLLNNHGGTMTVEDTLITTNSSSQGAGLLNETIDATKPSIMVVTRSTIRGNTATNWGGGLLNTGVAIITDSTFSANLATVGGGLYNDNATGQLTVQRTTVSGNSATYGGGIFNDDTGNPTLVVEESTITANSAGSGGGGGIHARGTVRIGATILAGNSSSLGPDCHLTMISQDYNLVGSTNGCTLSGSTAKSKLNVSADLLPLDDYGGPTATHALSSSSPALDSVDVGALGCRALLAVDQRGVRRAGGSRLGGTKCDIGAYETNSNQ